MDCTIRSALACLAFVFLAASVRAADVPPEAVLATTPFLDSDEPSRVIVDLSADAKQPMRMFLDTGASHSVMTPLAARAAGVSVRAIKDTPYRRKTTLGRDLQFWVDTRTSDTGSRTGEEYGLLGGNFLKDYVVELDFTMRSVRFLAPDRYAVPETSTQSEETVLPIRDSTRPIAEISIGGTKLPVILDTGCPLPVVLSGKAARQAGIDVDSLQPFGQLLTGLGPTELRLYEAATLEIGGLRFEQVPIFVAPRGWFGAAGEANDSVIGFDLLSRFLVRIDYPHKRLWLRRESQQVIYAGVDYAHIREAGAFLAPIPGFFYVVGIVPGTPAARLGLRSGDQVLRSKEVRTPETVLQAIRDGKPVMVMRDVGGILTDVELSPSRAAATP
jgi:predicted aspartyl protease